MNNKKIGAFQILNRIKINYINTDKTYRYNLLLQLHISTEYNVPSYMNGIKAGIAHY